MEIKSDHSEHGFQFPGTFELSVVGTAGKALETELPRLLALCRGGTGARAYQLETFVNREVCVGADWLPCAGSGAI